MARAESDRWDLATSVGATATMVAAQRALASDAKLIDDPYAAPLVRAVGIDVYVRVVNGQIPVGGQANFDPRRMAEGMACRTRFYDQFFLDATRERNRPGGDTCVGSRCARLPAAVAGGHRRLRGRHARGDRIQDPDTERSRCRADRRAAHRRRRLARRLGHGAAVRRDSTPRLPRRGVPKGYWSTCRTKPRTRCSTTSPL